ncbi:MAG: aldehyde dehydrogenase family protein, partial [Flavobacteriaceae bacterium]
MSSVVNIYEKQRLFYNLNKTKDIAFRKRILIELKNTLLNREEDILFAIKKDLGKHYYESYLTEYFMIISEIKKTIKNISSWTRPKRVKSSILNFPSKDYLLSDPYGCTLQISPWNYPFQLSMATLIGSIAAGNTIILKPSEYAPKTSEIISEIISSVFEDGHVNVVMGGPKVASELLKLRWDHIIFTGSTKVGKVVASAAAKHLTPTILELGGKSPCIVDQTAKIKLSSKRIAWAKFLNCGQTCIAPDYVLVHNKIKGKFIENLSSEIKNLYGNKA